MDFASGADAIHRREATAPPLKDSGVTLIELLVALVLASVILSVVSFIGLYEAKSWNTLTPDYHLHTNLELVDEKLQDVFQNCATMSVDNNYPTGTAVTGKDVAGNLVTVRLQQPSVDNVTVINGRPLLGIVVVSTPVGSPQPSTKVITLPGVSLGGTSFTVVGSNIQMTLVGAYVAKAPPTTYQLTDSFAVGGGF